MDHSPPKMNNQDTCKQDERDTSSPLIRAKLTFENSPKLFSDPKDDPYIGSKLSISDLESSKMKNEAYRNLPPDDPRYSLLNYQDDDHPYGERPGSRIDVVHGDIGQTIKQLSYDDDDDSQVNHLTSRTIKEEEKSFKPKESYCDDHNSLTLSHSGESYQQSYDKEFGKSLKSNAAKIRDSSNKSKKISQESASSMQNNRYGKNFDGEKSLFSGSFGGGLLESSRLVTEEYASPNQSRTFRDLSKYLSKSDKTTPNKNKDLIHEQHEYVDQTQNFMIRNEKAEENKFKNQAQQRYSSSKLREPEELIQYSHNFSTFENHEEGMAHPTDTQEDRIRPARFSSAHGPKNVYERLYQPKRKEKIKKELVNIIAHQGGFPPQNPRSKKNTKYIQNLDNKLSSARAQMRKDRLHKIREEQIQSQLQDKPQLSEGTHKITENIGIKNVFDRQNILHQAKQKVAFHNSDKERYNKAHGITNKPQINPRSKSLHRTIDDLYQWQKKKLSKLESQRKKSASPKIINISTKQRVQTQYESLPVEQRLLMHGEKTRQKREQKINEIKEIDEEEYHARNDRTSYTYPSKPKAATFHSHYVYNEENQSLRNDFLDPVREQLELDNEAKGWSNLSLLERNQMFLQKKEAKLEEKRNTKFIKEVEECSFEPILCQFNPEKLSMTTSVDRIISEGAKISRSLERVLETQNRSKNRNYIEIHTDKIRQRSLENDFLRPSAESYHLKREKLVKRNHKELFLKPYNFADQHKSSQSRSSRAFKNSENFDRLNTDLYSVRNSQKKSKKKKRFGKKKQILIMKTKRHGPKKHKRNDKAKIIHLGKDRKQFSHILVNNPMEYKRNKEDIQRSQTRINSNESFNNANTRSHRSVDHGRYISPASERLILNNHRPYIFIGKASYTHIGK
ncbi:unnamed protein product [Moneuplotes crassus]|uniref:Uncharacterized protein n=1 Tax=Euplotes crassus TaxID=5936 RepID=A0AAD1XY66_EUPCR|nr:unnamed protein product [Moneuplotes crassus]